MAAGRAQDRYGRSSGRSPAITREVYRCGHAQPHGLSNEAQMNLSASSWKARQFFILALAPLLLLGQSTDSNVWPTYNGGYSGRRFSPLTGINSANIGNLSLAWFYRIANIGPQRVVGN